jgi:probable phosphoglycerate mutase
MSNNIDKTCTGTLYLLRHGDSRLDGVERYVGQSDLSLNSEGRVRALNWQKEFADIPLKRIFCSDLSCSFETACIIAGGRSESVQPLTKLREINMGAWDGQPINDICRLCPDEYEKRDRDMVYHRPPAGECFSDVAARVIPLFKEIVRSVSGNLLIVGHEGVNKVLLCHILGMPVENMSRLRQDYGCLNVVDCGRDEMRLVSMNIDSLVAVRPLAAKSFRRADAQLSLSPWPSSHSPLSVTDKNRPC